jgi:hypothetical protein
MAKKRAFVRYSKNGKLVPGSLIVTQGTHPDKPSTWKEVPYDICCGGGGCPQLGPFIFTLADDLPEFGAGPFAQINFYCLNGSSPTRSGSSGGLGFELQTPVIVEPTLSEVVDIINTNLATQGIVAQLVEGVLQVTVSNTDYISTSCESGATLQFSVSFSNPA